MKQPVEKNKINLEKHLEDMKSALYEIYEIADLSCRSMQLQTQISDLLSSDAPDALEMIEEYQKEISLLEEKISILKITYDEKRGM